MTTLSGPLLVVAGPGSGKTRVLTHRIAALIATEVAPWRILAVTFTNKAAGEMRNRLAELVGGEVVDDMWVGTFHSICARVLRSNSEAAGLPRSFSILDETDVLRVLRDVVGTLNIEADRKELRKFSEAISWAKNHAQRPDQVDVGFKTAVVVQVMEAYQKRLSLIGACDFDDLLGRTLDLLKSNTEVLDRYQQRFSHVLVDEYQDTNVVQYQIVKLLAATSSNLCVVGDYDQSVYQWRGSSPEILESFDRDWPTCSVIALDQNYRSSRRIVEATAAIIATNPSRHRGLLWTANDEGAPVLRFKAADDRDEAAWVLSRILERRSAGDKLLECAVLMRTNAQTRSFEEELMRRNVNYQVVGALRFYERAEIKDALSWLRLVANPADRIAFARAVGAPRRGVGDATVSAVFAAIEPDEGPVSAARRLVGNGGLATRAANALGGFLTAFDRVGAACRQGPAAGLSTVLDSGGLEASFRRDPDGESRLENLRELVASASRYETGSGDDGFERCVQFLSDTALASPEDQDAGEDGAGASGDRVQLLTAHSAKGKEFDHVFVVGAEEGLFPHRRAISGESDSLAEERRLFYVACSRARRTLTISSCSSRLAYGDIVENPPSRFLDDLPEDVEVEVSKQVIHGRRDAGRGRRGLRDGSVRTIAQVPSISSRSVAPWGPSRVAETPTGPRLTCDELSKGAKVRHGRFGEGTVVAVRTDSREALIDFSGATKLLGLDYAPLEMI